MLFILGDKILTVSSLVTVCEDKLSPTWVLPIAVYF